MAGKIVAVVAGKTRRDDPANCDVADQTTTSSWGEEGHSGKIKYKIEYVECKLQIHKLMMSASGAHIDPN